MRCVLAMSDAEFSILLRVVCAASWSVAILLGTVAIILFTGIDRIAECQEETRE